MTSRLPAAPSAAGRPDRSLADVLLTARQTTTLMHCVARGYYTIPRRLTLGLLGRELGISAASLSLILRRAEAKIILAYAQRWQADPSTLAPAKSTPA